MTYKELIKKKEKEWDCPDLMDRVKQEREGKIPFSSPLMNWSTYGGVPKCRISEFFGEPGSGKSTTAIDVCKNAITQFEHEYITQMQDLQSKASNGDKAAKIAVQELEERGPQKVLYVDLEHAFDSEWAEVLGVDTDVIEIMQPPNICAEDILQTVEDVISTGEIGLVVLDSIPSLVTRAELEKKYGERTVASLAGLLTVFCRKIVSVLTRYSCTLIFINQIRDNLDNPYVDNTPGGKAVKFYSSMRMSFRLGAPIDILGNELPQKTENPVGYIVNVRLVKQKTAPFDRKNATYYLMCQSGIRADYDFAQLAIKKYGIIQKGGAWFTICDPYTGEILMEKDPVNPEKEKPVKINGMSKVFEYLSENTEYYKRLQQFIIDDINGKATVDENSEGTSY